MSAWQRCEELRSHKDFPGSVIPRGQGTCWADDTHQSGYLSSPAHAATWPKKWFSTRNLLLKQVKTTFFPILTNQWFSLENLPLLHQLQGGLEARTEVWAPAHEFLVTKLSMYLHTTYLWKAKEEGSQPGAAPFVRANFSNLGFARLGSRMESFITSISCQLTMKTDPLPRSCQGQRLCGNAAGHHYLWRFSHPGNKVDATRHDF